ncbi:MAG TPA: hypothetical protein VFW68_04415 [Rhodocyclaceae bacterium]|nr:hypothetical protein [Rhodocyclaceae bacterium]
MSKSRPNNRSAMAGHGAILLLAVLVLGGLVTLGERFNASSLRNRQAKITTNALAQAKEALLAYAVSHAAVPGILPCPDINNAAAYEGSPKVSGANCAAYIGRLPWKKLGLSDLRDGSGECLWYALSPRFQDAGTHTVANGKAINSTVSGTLAVQDAFGQPLAGSPLIAIVFAPGPPLSGQDRSTSSAHPICGGNDIAGNYLDKSANGINNATGNGVFLFALSDSSATFNDTAIGISATELLVGVQKRVIGEIGASLKLYHESAGALPYSATNADTGIAVVGQETGFVPWYDLQPPPLISGLTSNAKNGWYSLITYRRKSATSASLVLDGKPYDYAFQ